MVKWLLRAVAVLGLLLLAAFWQLFFSSRPPLTINPATLAGDGSTLNYCELPVLDGSGKMAADIPKGNTPGCGYEHFPLPVLAGCTEPLPEGAADIRGLWIGVKGGHVGHVERVEQCGNRTVVTSSGIIHDYGPNSTAGLNTNDTEGSVLFILGDREYCARSSASMIWNNGVLDFHAFGWGPVVVQRYLEQGPNGEQLVWEYADGSTTHMDRICTLPGEHKIPRPRGKRITLFAD
ncbi:MAG: hypothetical protein HKO71_01005 [Pseudomonadales bacterium]|nr:hypothetical protein [Gammaproteobacteria bacterium]NNL56304.1 hypothetical protein [Pseudomonadales bacterium]